jgi:hypothetical protein
MDKKSLLFTLIFMFICTGASVSLIPSTVQAAITDHVFDVEIDRGYAYQYPGTSDDEYAFDLCLWTDDTVNKVAFLTPQDEDWAFEAELDSGSDDAYEWYSGREYDTEEAAYEWCFEVNADSLDGLDNFGDGNYTITVYYENGTENQTTVVFENPNTNGPIVQPTEKPVINTPQHNSTIAFPFTFEWNACSEEFMSTHLYVEEYDSEDEMIDVSFSGCTTDSYSPSLPEENLPLGEYIAGNLNISGGGKS